MWLMPLALVCSGAGLLNNATALALWPKLLPACVFVVTVMTFIIGGRIDDARKQKDARKVVLDLVPAQVIVAGIASSVGAILFSDRQGQLVGVGFLCCTMAASFASFPWVEGDG